MTLTRNLHKNHLAQILLVILLGCCAYSNTLHVPFFLDDYDVIVNNPTLDSLPHFFTGRQWGAPAFRARWFVMFTLAVNKSLGGASVAGFHVVNIAIHLSCGLLILRIARDTLATFGESIRQRHPYAPLLAALLFVLHPVQTQAVTYITQRMASLATLCCLAALCLYIRAFPSANAHHASSHLRRTIRYSGALLCCLLAMGSKEISFTLPFTLIVYDLFFLAGTPRQRLLRLLPFSLCLLLLLFGIYGLHNGTGPAAVMGNGPGTPTLPHRTYLLTECRVVMTYLRLLILPVGQNLNYDYPVFDSFLNAQVLSSALFLAGLALFAARLIVQSYRCQPDLAAVRRIGGFAILWFLITLSVESGAIPLLDVIFEHRLYLPSVWPAIAAAVLVSEFRRHGAHFRRPVTTAACLVLLALAIATYQRNRVWGSEETLWGDVIAKAPGNARGWANLGTYYLQRLQPQRAIPLLERAVAIAPAMYEGLYTLGVASLQTGDLKRAGALFAQTTRVAPFYPNAWKMAGNVRLQEGNIPEALTYLRRAVELDPADSSIRSMLEQATARHR